MCRRGEAVDPFDRFEPYGIGDSLARTLTSTNPIESMISISRTTARSVKLA